MPKLYVVATPIGNLSDASERMVQTLASCGFIAAEDTRVTANLLRHFNLRVPLVSCHRHSEAQKSSGIIARMLEEDVDAAVVTDAGTPCISDPGHLLVREAIEAGIEVLPVPGPTAMASAVSISGFDAKEFSFYGFLPREHADLQKKLLEIGRGTPVAVLHESPHRVVELMETVCETLPNCRACVCCDLTKLYEKTLHGTAEEVLQALRDNPKTEKGEYCIVLDLSEVPHEEETQEKVSLEARLAGYLMEGLSAREAVERLSDSGVKSNEAKRAMLNVRKWLEELE